MLHKAWESLFQEIFDAGSAEAKIRGRLGNATQIIRGTSFVEYRWA